MKVLVFKTNIKSKKKLQVVKPIINQHPVISDWSIDRDDVDNVLRIEASENLNEKEVIHMIQKCGFNCEELTD